MDPIDSAQAWELSIDPSLLFLEDSQHLEALIDYFPALEQEGITATFAATGGGDYTEVWVTTSSRPHESNTRYDRIW